MGTRGAFGFYADNELKLTFCLDVGALSCMSYPLMRIIRQRSDQELKAIAAAIRLLPEEAGEVLLTEPEFQAYRSWLAAAAKLRLADIANPAARRQHRLRLWSLRFSRWAQLTWFEALRFQAVPIELYGVGCDVMLNANDFPHDPVWCENVVVADLYRGKLEFYQGNTEQSGPAGRFGTDQTLVAEVSFTAIRLANPETIFKTYGLDQLDD